MTDPPATAASQTRPAFLGTRTGRTALLAAAFALFCAVSVRPIVHSEARYVESAREMVANGDWVVPHLSFVPYFEKPILTYWLAVLSQLVFGMGSVAVRLPSILACVAMVWTTFEFGRRLRGNAFGLGAAALLASSAFLQEIGTGIMTDPPFSAFLAFAWYAFWRHDREPQSRWIWAFWTSLGLAFMTKGPLGPALVGSTVFFYLLLSGRLRDLVRMRFVRGTALLVLLNLPWSYLVWQRDPRFLEFFYVRQNLRAFESGEINHPGPPWYYLYFLPALMYPFGALGGWAVVAETWDGIAAGVRRLLGRGDAVSADPSRLYLACAVLGPFLLLSAAGSKLGTYILPLCPAAALMLAGYVADRLASPRGPLRWATLGQAAVIALLLLAVPFALPRLPANWQDAIHREPWAIAIAALLFAVPALAGAVWMARGRVLAGMKVVAAGTLAAVLVINAMASDLMGERDCAALMPRLVAVRKPGERVIVSGPNVDDYTIVLALRDRPYVWGFARELGMGHFTEQTAPDVPLPQNPYDVSVKGGKGGDGALPGNPWLVDEKRLREMWTGTERVWFVGRPKDLAKVKDLGLDAANVLVENEQNVIASNQPLPR